MTIVCEIVFSYQDLNNVFFFNDSTSDLILIKFVKALFYCIPTFPLSVIYGAMTKIAATHLEPEYLVWKTGRKYTWDDFTSEEKGLFGVGLHYTMPSPFSVFILLFGDIILFFCLTWYFDHTVSSNRGVAE